MAERRHVCEQRRAIRPYAVAAFPDGEDAGDLRATPACALFSPLICGPIQTIKPFMLCAGAAYILLLAAPVLRSKLREAQSRDFADSFSAGAKHDSST